MYNVNSLEDIDNLYKRIIYTVPYKDPIFFHAVYEYDTLVREAIKAGAVIRDFHKMLAKRITVEEGVPFSFSISTKSNSPMRLYFTEQQFQEISIKNIDDYLKKLSERINHECYTNLRRYCDELITNYSCKPRMNNYNEYYPAFQLDCNVSCDIPSGSLSRRMLYNDKMSCIYKYYDKPIYVWEVEVYIQYKISMT